MRSLPYVSTLLLIVTSPYYVEAADKNGYTAEYECRAGGPRCSVDVAALASRTCDQVINPSTPWSSINWDNSTICIEAGDHTWKGTLTVPSWADGSSASYKVLRHYRNGDNNDEPWKQGSNQAKLAQLRIMGSYWLVHRLSFAAINKSGYSPRVQVNAAEGGVNNVIVNRIFVQGADNNPYYFFSENCRAGPYDRITVQNSVMGGYYGNGTPSEIVGLDLQCGSNLHAVNNEIYDVAAHQIQTGANVQNELPGLVIENNDLYYSPAAMTQGEARVKGENPLSFKGTGVRSSPAKVIHNRIWGARTADLSYCCNGSSGPAVAFGAGGGPNANWILFQDNIVFESQQGIEHTHWNAPSSTNNTSIIGNIFYKILRYRSDYSSTVWWAGAYGVNTTEHYLNTIIEADRYAAGPFNTNNDFRCNVAIDAASKSSSDGSGTQWSHNAYYGTKHANDADRIDNGLSVRANSTNYGQGAIIRLSSNPSDSCTSANDSDCFLYEVVVAGTSGGSAPAYCTTLGCTTTDGTMTVQAIRGPYSFYRKLRTSPELYIIPYARPHASAAEAGACPADFASRTGIGINDAQ